MSLRDVSIKDEYRSLQDNIVKSFYMPLLNQAVLYQRAVGFFSSSALLEISRGISGLVRNGGKINLIASPKLSEEDVDAIARGIAIKEDVIAERLCEALDEPKNKYEEEKLNLLVNLVARDILTIKIAVLEDANNYGIYHEKLGVISDAEGNYVSFSGSMNESTTAFMHNYESIDVFKSWEAGKDSERALKKKTAFAAMWDDYEPYMKVMGFPEAAKKRLFTYRKNDSIDLSIDDEDQTPREESKMTNVSSEYLDSEGTPRIPSDVIIRDYQNEAIDKWESRDYVGIFDMATGTGKTYTGLAAIERLFTNRKVPLAVLIVCPYQHLVDQWVEDIVKFGMKPIICYSASPQKKWEDRLKDSCLELQLGMTECMCAIFTNSTFCLPRIQNTIDQIKPQAVLVVDEAHNFGAAHLSKFLDKKIPYRLALSATLERHGDDEGTNRLFDYFEEKCITYSLKEAIDNDKLVKYYYHPIVVNFEEDELKDYLEISSKIAKAYASSNGETTEAIEILLIKRARLIAASRQKVSALLDELETMKNENHILVYCGATTMKDIDYDENNPPDEEKRQIDLVMKRIGNDLEMKVAKFTSEEDAQQRNKLKREFDNGTSLQVLVAIRCLDEGVNIPSINKAFILASSTNPKEYIQRRGRVLRKFSGKKYADIYDFIMCPIPIENAKKTDEQTINLSKSLLKREIIRMKDFAALAENPIVADKIMGEFITEFGIEMEEEDE